MAEKTEEGKAPSSSENLTCPLCLDIFDEATILTSCGHTFCRKCLKNYDLSHQDLDHMICPLCRNITKLTANRVDESTADHTSVATITKKAHDKTSRPAYATSAAVIAKKAREKRFKPADDTHLDLGSISESTTDHTSVATITKKAHDKTSRPAYATNWGIGIISESDPKLQVIQCVGLRGCMSGMTPYSDASVAIGYNDAYGIDIIDTDGSQGQYANIPSNMDCHDLVFQKDRSLCISTIYMEAHIYSPNGSRKSIFHSANEPSLYSLVLDRSSSDEVLVTHNNNKVFVYDPTGSTLKHTVLTKHYSRNQISSTRSGLIVTSSCFMNPSVLTVYDRNGNAGNSLQGPSNVYLYAAVDEQDRVYVASCDNNNGTLVIRLYDLEGLKLKERVEFNVLNLKLYYTSCYLVSLSPDMLAFACDRKLYFIKVSL